MDGMTPGEDQKLDEGAARADMRIEVVKRELNQGALAGFDSSVTEYAARLVIAALDSFDEDALAAEFRRGFEAGEVNAALIEQAAYRAGREDAAREIVEHADLYAPREGNIEQRRMRRHLMIAVQVASPKATLEEIAEAVRRGDYVACHLDEAGQSIDLGRFTSGGQENTP